MGDLVPSQHVSTVPVSGTQKNRVFEYDYDGNGRNDINRFSLTARRVGQSTSLKCSHISWKIALIWPIDRFTSGDCYPRDLRGIAAGLVAFGYSVLKSLQNRLELLC